ncbi:MAG: hypothetical protein KF819_10855 [Labilithrix sp.]|nr:hypothetical protein [Labilithrix sp.]
MSTRSIAEEIRDELPSLGVDPDTKKALDEWLAADREFNGWFLVTTKRALADDELMELLEGYRESQETMQKAWKTFREDKNQARLAASVAISISRMHALMNE